MYKIHLFFLLYFDKKKSGVHESKLNLETKKLDLDMNLWFTSI